MKTTSKWSYTPYREVINDGTQIFICRIAPAENSVGLDWFPMTDAAVTEYTVHWRNRGCPEETEIKVNGLSCEITGLEHDADYEVYVTAGDRLTSRVRLVRTGDAPGTVVNYLHPDDTAFDFSGYFLSSPSLLKLDDGTLLASIDVFGKLTPQNLTQIFRSEDGGVTWKYNCDLFPCFWGKLFEHRGKIYMLSVSNEYGDLLIGRSDDGGKTFETPTVLMRSSCSRSIGGMHKNAMPVIEHNGRLWTSIEYGTWNKGGQFHFMLLSAPVDADLTDAASWVFTDPVEYDEKWPGAAVGASRGCIEGNAVVGPDDKLYCLLRYEIEKCVPNHGWILKLSADENEPEAMMKFSKFVPFCGNKSKFDILRDPVSGAYYSICDKIRDKNCAGHRNLLVLLRSEDLDAWTEVATLLDYTDCDPKKVGVQYVSFLYDGDDIIYLCRVGISGADSFHNSNYITFHRIKNFRNI